MGVIRRHSMGLGRGVKVGKRGMREGCRKYAESVRTILWGEG